MPDPEEEFIYNLLFSLIDLNIVSINDCKEFLHCFYNIAPRAALSNTIVIF